MSEPEIMDEQFIIRTAQESDCDTILGFIKKLAEYERLPDQVVATTDSIRRNIFQKKYAEVLFAELEGKPVGFALFFHNFSTFVGKPGIYLEDLFVDPEFRGRSYGKQLLIYLAKLAMERDCGRLEWAVLNWNRGAISFYKSLGARSLDDWTVFRIAGDDLSALADRPCAGWK